MTDTMVITLTRDEPLPSPTPPPNEVKVVQRFSRRAVGFLWEKRAELDPAQVAILDAIHKNKKKGRLEAEQTIFYKLARGKVGSLGYGRLYGQKGSLETLERECRGTICREFYHDIDVVNAHPVILLQLAKRNYNRDLPEVEKYVSDRNSYLNRINENREIAKQEIIRVFYGGTPNHEFLQPLYQEVRAFTRFLTQQHEFTALYQAVKTEHNVYGTFLSYILQTYERSVMLAMKRSFERQGWKVGVLCYDGLMVEKNADLELPECLRAAEEDIRVETGLRVSLLSKEFEFFEMPEMKEEVVDGVSKEAYEAMKAEFERTHFYHTPTDTYGEEEDGAINYFDRKHAREYFKSKWRFQHSEKFEDFTEFFMIWCDDVNRREVKLVDYKEHPNDPFVYTPPLSFSYKRHPAILSEERRAYLVALFLGLAMICAGNDPILYEFLLNWFAHILQNPFELAGVAIIITGDKGTGKDTLMDFFIEYVLGTKFGINYQTNEQFFDKHDCGRENKFLVKLEEADRSFCMKDASALKSLITAPNSTFNPKGKKAFSSPNYNRFAFTTNKANPVEMNDGERRFCIMGCSSEKKGDFDYWTSIRTDLFSKDGATAVADYLLARDLSNFNVRVLPPNAYQNDVIESEMSSEDRFVKEWDGQECAGNELYNQYRSYCIDNNLPYATSSISFGKRLLKYIRDGAIKRETRGGNKNYYWKRGVLRSTPES